MSTYYVDSSITDTYVASATPDFTTYNHLTFETTGGSDSVYKTIADINACTFVPDDFIYFRKGQTWRESLTVGQSGTSGHPITFGAFGTGDKPKIYGSDQITGWTVYGGNIWQATTAINPNESIFFVNTDGSVKWGTKQANADACDAEYEFFSNGTTMYCYALTDPDSRYTSVEAPTRLYCVDATGRSYITIDGLDIRHFTDNGIRIYTDTVYNTVQNCHISHGGENVGGAGQGIQIRGSYHQIIGNTIHDCRIHGIRTSTASGKTTSNLTISQNEVYDCYHSLIDLSNANATGVSTDHKVTRNFLYTTSNYAYPLLSCEGIYVASSAATQEDIEVSYNVIINIFCAAIQIDDTCNNVNIFNNTCYGTNPLNTTLWSTGIAISDTGVTGVVVKNNIVMNFYSGAGGGDNCLGVQDSVAISSLDNNCWYQSVGTRAYVHVDANFYHSDDFAAYKTYIQGILTGAEAHSLWESPLFVNAGGTTPVDYILASNSPCISTGCDVGLTQDYGGTAVWGPVTMGAYQYTGQKIRMILAR